MNYQIELFHSLLNEFLQGESALLTLDGDVLGVRGEQGASYGTLTTAAKTVSQYLNLQEGDIAILNDPYSGGRLLSDMTFVMAVSEDLLWVTRRSLGNSIKLAKSIEEEGLRIPPTPLRQKNQINEIILSAMESHPACPPQFGAWVKTQIQDLTSQAKKLLDVIEYTGFTITGELIEEYLELSRQMALQKISERSYGEARVDLVLDSGELLRMTLEIQEGRIALDFGGTSAAKTVSLTESAAYGACFYALSRHYGFEMFANSGSFSILQITKPTGCWLVAKYPASTYKGMICGVATLETAIELALSQLHLKQQRAMSSRVPLSLELKYKDQATFLSLNGGQGAQAHSEGQCAQLSGISLEQIERDFPVKILSLSRREATTPAGKHRGGRGLELRLQAQENLQATWVTDLTLHRPRQPKNCHQGDPCQITLEQMGSPKTLPVLGSFQIQAGDILTLSSGSGGGYGKE